MNKLLLLFIPIALVVIVPTPCLGNANYTNICLNSSNYNGAATIGSYTCDVYLSSQSGIDWNDPASTTSTTLKEHIRTMIGPACCSDGKSVLHIDYSKICKDPTKYIGSTTMTFMGGTTGTCDFIIPSVGDDNGPVFKNMPFSTLKCSDLKDVTYQLEKMIAPKCCSDFKTICYRDYSKLCKDPSTYNENGIFNTDAGSDEMNLCDSNTCADYNIENGDGSTVNLLEYMELKSKCCGANGGGMAKNGCKAALDTTAFGPKSISIGAISFILPMIVMAYFHCAI